MEICMRIGNETHHYAVPVVENAILLPVTPIRNNYPPFLYDAVLVASAQATTNRVSDDRVRAGARPASTRRWRPWRDCAGQHFYPTRQLGRHRGRTPDGWGCPRSWTEKRPRGSPAPILASRRPPRGDQGCRRQCAAREAIRVFQIKKVDLMKPFILIVAFAIAAGAFSPVSGGTIITTNLPSGDVIINMNSQQDAQPHTAAVRRG